MAAPTAIARASAAIPRRRARRCCPSAPVGSADPIQTDGTERNDEREQQPVGRSSRGGAANARLMDANIGAAGMKVAYVYELDAEDITVQSGRPYAILQEMRARDWQVVPCFPPDRSVQRRFLWKKIAYRATGYIYRPDRERQVLDDLAAQVGHRMADAEIDCVFGPG